MAVAVISGDNILVTAKKWFLVKSAVTRICPRVPTLRLLFVQGTIIVGTGVNRNPIIGLSCTLSLVFSLHTICNFLFVQRKD